jgi:NADH-quinone oxidoreductase subunit K
MTSLILFWLVIGLLMVAGLYLVLVTRNLLRLLMGLEILTKAATLMLVVVGWGTGRMDLAQAFVLTLIVVEVVVIATAAGLVYAVWQRNGSLDVRSLQRMKE